MEVRFWGTRGSLPASLSASLVREKVREALETAADKGLSPEDDLDAFMDNHLPFHCRATYGTNTSCVEFRDGDRFLLCDAGSGLRDFGNHIMGLDERVRPREFHLLLSHLHWDHIQGFPFFVPALLPGYRIILYGCHSDLEKAFSIQQSEPFFPVDFSHLASDVRFVTLTPDQETEIAGFRVTPKEQNHPGKSFGYRLERNGTVMVYSTDAEHKNNQEEDMSPFTDFFQGADLLIFDAQYTFADACTVKEDWGHSNNLIGVEMAQKAGVRHLVLYHQDPNSTDRELERLLSDTQKLSRLLQHESDFRVSIAWDGMVLEL
ncbi:MAG: MBL fold metallo-hydrolase [Desulfobacteraceae bacterium]|jgi:phosphoribosyl 1,2-cyclic phosphodiesterase